MALAAVAALVVAAAMTWPTLLHPASTVPEDLGDPLLQVWQTAWGGHALLHQPTRIFDGNIFYPLPNSLAFSDSLLGYAPAGLIGSGATAALVRYNLLYVGAFALCSLGAYLLARQLGCRTVPAALAGVVFGYAPWRIAQAGHLHVLSAGAIPLALALLTRGHGVGGSGARRPTRPWLAFAGWVVAAWQLTIGFALGLPFAYGLGLLAFAVAARWLVGGRRGRSVRWPGRLLAADLGGIALFVAIGASMAEPYLQVARAHPEAQRSAAEVALYSPPLLGFVTAPAQDRLWGPVQAAWRARLFFPPEMTLAIGFTALGLAMVGLLLAGQWSLRRRLVLAIAAGAAIALGMGTRLAGGRWTYLPLLEHAPGWRGIRTPGRLVVFATLAVALLAAAGAQALGGWTGGRRGRAAGLLPAVACLLALAEGASTIPHPSPGGVPAAFRQARPPIVVLPSDDFGDDLAMYWSTDGFPALANGSSGFVPLELARLRAVTATFPSPSAVAYLRDEGIRTVVLVEPSGAVVDVPIDRGGPGGG